MYLHRPDLLSLAFGIAFLVLGLLAVVDPVGLVGIDPAVVVALLAVALGIGIAGSVLTGDVHARAAQRLHDRAAARAARAPAAHPVSSLPAPPPRSPLEELQDDPLFGPPIDPDELERVYRETFGDEDPAALDRPSGEGAPDGAAG
jgi:hypothetical protein